MSQKRDYYEVLGVARTASTADIKSAYAKIVMRNHPDRLKLNTKLTDTEKAERLEVFQQATEAEKVLADTTARAAYDQYGHKGVENLNAGKSAASGQSFADVAGPTLRKTYSETDTFDFFESRRSQREKGEDPDSKLDVMSIDERRARAREERLRNRRGTSTPTAETPVSTPAVTHTQENVSDTFRDVAQKVDDAAATLRREDATIPLDALQAFRDALERFTGEVDKAIARAKKGGPAPGR